MLVLHGSLRPHTTGLCKKRLSVSDLLEYEPKLDTFSKMFPLIDPTTYRLNWEIFFHESIVKESSSDDIASYFRDSSSSSIPDIDNQAKNRCCVPAASMGSYQQNRKASMCSRISWIEDSDTGANGVNGMGGKERDLRLAQCPLLVFKRTNGLSFAEMYPTCDDSKPGVYIGCSMEFLAASQRLKVKLLKKEIGFQGQIYTQNIKLFAQISLTKGHKKMQKANFQKDPTRNDKCVYFPVHSLLDLPGVQIKLYRKKRGFMKKPLLLGTWTVPLSKLDLYEEMSAWAKFEFSSE